MACGSLGKLGVELGRKQRLHGHVQETGDAGEEGEAAAFDTGEELMNPRLRHAQPACQFCDVRLVLLDVPQPLALRILAQHCP
jgi:hypothetical protein